MGEVAMLCIFSFIRKTILEVHRYLYFAKTWKVIFISRKILLQKKSHSKLLLLKTNFRSFLVDTDFSTIKLLPLPFLYCGKEGSKERTMHSHTGDGVLGSTSLTAGYLHKLCGILLGKIIYFPNLFIYPIAYLHQYELMSTYWYLFYALSYNLILLY